MCDKLKETDEKYMNAKNLVEKDGCSEANIQLSKCLKIYSNDWRLCSQETNFLKDCLAKSRKGPFQLNNVDKE